eukprot:CAMPEP_0204588808 /NCGR_PEP_ID=MMETSP0661-20131031/48831_1 /ASSEMBLY_ACC=CAM_ASM_000606 /TAXON_ID=109239 /ORGANISM="Alexandrium margalefi, Strain AMGDE01CS-322" /LENGTH=152 /DNA_ID=CAMNT_0051598651 /DNA_START=26 /DNA_END=480 /DNA_ORIENTATION=+
MPRAGPSGERAGVQSDDLPHGHWSPDRRRAPGGHHGGRRAALPSHTAWPPHRCRCQPQSSEEFSACASESWKIDFLHSRRSTSVPSALAALAVGTRTSRPRADEGREWLLVPIWIGHRKRLTSNGAGTTSASGTGWSREPTRRRAAQAAAAA